MANVLQWNQSTNSFSVSGATSVTPVVGEGIDNNFSVEQSFQAGISVSGSTTLQAVSGTTGTFTGAVTALANAATTSGSLAGTTAGTVDYSMPDQGVAKKFVAFFNAYENDTTTNQTITFPVAFVNAPAVGINTTGLTVSGTTTTEVVIAAPNATTTYTGVLTFEGI